MGEEKIIAYGHPHITAKHDSTIEITKDKEMGYEAHCIVGVRASKGCYQLSKKLKEAIKKTKKLTIKIKAGKISDAFIAFGHPDLTLKDKKDVVIRKSSWIDGRTLCIYASKSANELKRELVRKLQNPEQKIEITISFKA